MSAVPMKTDIENKEFSAMIDSWQTGNYIKVLQSKGFDIQVFGHDYGGPKTLAQFRAYIEFPYQVSTMKVRKRVEREQRVENRE